MSTEELTEVKADDEFGDGERELVTVNGVEVGVLHVDSKYFAVRNRRLHDCVLVAARTVEKKLVDESAEPGK